MYWQTHFTNLPLEMFQQMNQIIASCIKMKHFLSKKNQRVDILCTNDDLKIRTN